ncbi:MAG: hypothetical protein ABL964_03555 [Steroidobacteraceae bacterium]
MGSARVSTAESASGVGSPPSVVVVADVGLGVCSDLLAPYGIEVVQIESAVRIPGSYWGESEAGLIGSRVYCRADTPVHSLLHEACHFICMDSARRAVLERDAGGDFDEENAVCWLQIALAAHLGGMGADRMMADMDAWGYTFRLGSARAWVERDSADTRKWLEAKGLIDAGGRLTWRPRID